MIIIPLPFYERYFLINYQHRQVQADSGANGEIITSYFLSDFILAFMFLRIFFLCRSIFNYSIYTDPYSKKLCRSYGFTSGVRFTFKCYFEVHPEKTVLIVFTSTIMILAYLMRIFELPFYRHSWLNDSLFDNYFYAIWLIVITITTVGYGDLAPHTIQGKCIAIVTALIGAFLISLLVLAVNSVFELNKNQQKALRHIQMTRSAATTIVKSLRYFITKKKLYRLKLL